MARPKANTTASYFANEAREVLEAYAKEHRRGVRSLLDGLRAFDKLYESLGDTELFQGRTDEYVNENGLRRKKHIGGMLISFEELKDWHKTDWQILEYCLWAPGFLKDFKKRGDEQEAKDRAMPGPVQLVADLAAVRSQARAVSRELAKARRQSKRVYTIADELEARHRTWNTCERILLLLEVAVEDSFRDGARGPRRWPAAWYGVFSYRDLCRQLRLATGALKHATASVERCQRWLKTRPADTPYVRGKAFSEEGRPEFRAGLDEEATHDNSQT